VLNLDDLRAFRAVAQHGNFRVASMHLGIAVSALSRRVKILESQIGVQLLVRHSHGVRLTPAGIVLFNKGTILFELVEEMQAELQHRDGSVSGAVRIGMPPSLARLLAPELVSRVRSSHDQIFISIVEKLSDSLIDCVLGEHLDLAIVMGVERPCHIEMLPLFLEDLWVAGRNDSFPFHGDEAIDLVSLASLPIVQSNSSTPFRRMLDRLATNRGVTLNIVAEADSLTTILALVEQGVGCHVGPHSVVSALLNREGFMGCPLGTGYMSRLLISKRGRPINGAKRVVRDELLAIVAGLLGSTGFIDYSEDAVFV